MKDGTTLGPKSFFCQRDQLDCKRSQKLDVPSSLSVIDLPFGDILEKHFPKSFSQVEKSKESPSHSSSIQVEQQQFKCHNNEALAEEEPLSAQKVIVDLSGESVDSDAVNNIPYNTSNRLQQKHSESKSQSNTLSGHQLLRSKTTSNHRPYTKLQNGSHVATRYMAMSRPSFQHERFKTNNREPGASYNLPKSSQQLSPHKNPRSIILKRRGFDLQCFVCLQVLETYRQVGEHCRLHNLRQQCPVCRAKFSATSNMKRHCLGHFTPVGFPCSFCKATFRRKDNLRTHMLRHVQRSDKGNASEKRKSNDSQDRGGSSKDMECEKEESPKKNPVCETVTTVDGVVHRSQENDKINVPIKQEIEEVIHVDSETLQELATADNLNESMSEDYVAESVQQGKEEGSLGNHERIVNYNCSSCGLEFTDMQSIRKHVVMHHAEQINPEPSGEVDLQFLHHQTEVFQAPEGVQSLPSVPNESRESDIMERNDSVSASNKISFSNQDYNLSDVIDIESLSQMSNGDTNQSEISSEQSSFTDINSLSEPTSSSTPISTSGQAKRGMLSLTTFVCSICKQYLHSGDAIMEHQVMHANVMGSKLWCVACCTHVSSKDCLRRHINNHMGNRFQCPMCSSVYNRKDNLKKHVKDVHHLHYDKNGIVRPLSMFQE